MARTSEAATASRDPTYEETAIQAFAKSNLTPERSGQQTAPLLTSEELLHNVQGLTPEDRAKFVENLDQVRRDGPLSSLESPPHCFFKGIPDRRLTKREARNRLGEPVQRNRAASNFSRTLRRTREMRKHRRSIWRVDRCLARGMGWFAGGYQSLSYLPRP